MKISASRLFGIAYLLVWCASLALLLYFIQTIPKYVSIPIGLILMALAPDLETLRRLLSGEDKLRSKGEE